MRGVATRGLFHLSIRTRLFCAIGLLSVVATVIGIIAFSTLSRADRQIELLHSVSLAEVSRALELSQSAATLSKSAPFLLSLNPPFGISSETDEIYAAIARLESLAQDDAELRRSVARMRAAVDDLVRIIPQQNRISFVAPVPTVDHDARRYNLSMAGMVGATAACHGGGRDRAGNHADLDRGIPSTL